MPETSPTIDDQVHAHLWARRCDIVYRARLSTLYHLKRERFFDGLDKFASASTAVAATAAVATLLRGAEQLDLAVASATAVLSMVPLVLNPALKARHHAALAAEFRRLRADCEHAGEHLSEDACNSFSGRLAEIEAGEPAPLAGLVADCQNQLAVAGGDGPAAHLGWCAGWLKHWIDFRPAATAPK